MDYKKSKAPINTVTRDLATLWEQTGNIYKSVVIIGKRANQIGVEIKQDLNKKLADKGSTWKITEMGGPDKAEFFKNDITRKY